MEKSKTTKTCYRCLEIIEPENELFHTPGSDEMCENCRRTDYEERIGYDG